MSIADEISRLTTAKEAIRQAIIEKGVSVETTAKLDTYAAEIAKISTASPSSVAENQAKFFQETAATISSVAELRDSNSLFFTFITDTHVNTGNDNEKYFNAQMASMKALCEAIPPDMVVHGGDMSDGSESKARTLAIADNIVKQLREVGGDKTICLIGNHDGNTVQKQASGESDADFVTRVEGIRITEDEMVSLYRSWDDGFTYASSSGHGRLYGYKDFDCGIRVIRLHSYIEDRNKKTAFGGNGGNWGYYDEELAWLRTVGLKTNNDVLIICHQTLSPILQGYDEAGSRGQIPKNGVNMQTAIDTWQSEGLTIGGTKYQGNCIGVVHGHVHWDYYSFGKKTFTVVDHNTKEDKTSVGTHGEFYEYGQANANYLPSFSPTDNFPTSSYRDVPRGANYPGKSQSNHTQALWTAVVVNKATHKINFIRFGAGADIKGLDYTGDVAVTGITVSPKTATVEEGSTVTLTATVAPQDASVKTVSWSSSSANATVSGGVVTGVTAGSAVITATTTDGGYTDSCTVTVTEKEKVNLLPTALDPADMTKIYNVNGTPGYKTGVRLNSSGQDTNVSGACATGLIPATAGKTIYLKDMTLPSTSSVTNYNYCYIGLYKADGSLIKSSYAKDYFNINANHGIAENGYIKQLTLNVAVGTGVDLSQLAYIRLSTLGISNTSSVAVE